MKPSDFSYEELLNIYRHYSKETEVELTAFLFGRSDEKLDRKLKRWAKRPKQRLPRGNSAYRE